MVLTAMTTRRAVLGAAASGRQAAAPRAAPPTLARRPARVACRAAAAAAPGLERSLSAHGRCEINHPDGYQAYCNVIKGVTRDDGTQGYQFVVVFLQDHGDLSSDDYEFYRSEWFASMEACEAAIEHFDVGQLLAQA